MPHRDVENICGKAAPDHACRHSDNLLLFYLFPSRQKLSSDSDYKNNKKLSIATLLSMDVYQGEKVAYRICYALRG
jgi:hypothetical protein